MKLYIVSGNVKTDSGELHSFCAWRVVASENEALGSVINHYTSKRWTVTHYLVSQIPESTIVDAASHIVPPEPTVRNLAEEV